jgi:phasin protein
MLEETARAFPGANQEQIASIKAYIGANREFAQKLLNARDLPEAYRIQVDYFESQLMACAENATQVGANLAASFRTCMPLSNYLAARIEPTEIIARIP